MLLQTCMAFFLLWKTKDNVWTIYFQTPLSFILFDKMFHRRKKVWNDSIFTYYGETQTMFFWLYAHHNNKTTDSSQT